MMSDLKEAFSQKKDEKSDSEKIQNKRTREMNEGYVEIKRMTTPERGRGSGWQESARGQKTNYGDDDTNIVLCSCHTDKSTKQQTRFLSLTTLTERNINTVTYYDTELLLL